MKDTQSLSHTTFNCKYWLRHYLVDDRTQASVSDETRDLEKMKKEEFLDILKKILGG